MAARAVLWDFGGVIIGSPFEAFTRYEAANGLPDGLIRKMNSTDPDTNAWAQMERNEVDMDGFYRLFEAEALALGHVIDARQIVTGFSDTIRPQMVTAVRKCAQRIPTGMITNNFVGPNTDGTPSAQQAVYDLFHVVIESSKVGLRKPDPRIYELACERLDVRPAETVFLDDLGINLKPARALGMTTIKVIDPDDALDELEEAVGFAVR